MPYAVALGMAHASRRTNPPDPAQTSRERPPLEDAALQAAYQRMLDAGLAGAVPSTLRSLLPVVEATRDALRRSEKDSPLHRRASEAHLVVATYHGHTLGLEVAVSPQQADRALRLLDTLLRALAVCGCEIKTSTDGHRKWISLAIGAEEFRLRLREVTKREKYIATPDELAEARASASSRIPMWDYQPTGLLTLSLCDNRWASVRQLWTEAKRARFENQIADLAHGILSVVDRDLTRRKAEFSERRRRVLEMEAARNAEAAKKAEDAQVEDLYQQAKRWEDSRRVRRYLRVARETMLKVHGQIVPGSQMDKWFVWANEMARQMDPLTKANRAASAPTNGPTASASPSA